MVPYQSCFRLFPVLLSILFGIGICLPCGTDTHLVPSLDGMTSILDSDACGSFGDNSELSVGEMSSSFTLPTVKAVCTNSELFCFPSLLNAFVAEEDNHKSPSIDIFGGQIDVALPEVPVLHDSWESNSSWVANHGAFTLSNGKIVSCALNSGLKPRDPASNRVKTADQRNGDSGGGHSLKYHRPFNILDKKSELITSDILDRSLLPNLDISPPFLDWGDNYLYFPSSAFVTVTNKCKERRIHLYKPFTSDQQFYPCDFDYVLLGPGEEARICFVFLPQQLGPLSAHIVLQTSEGGFLIQARGVVVESLYQIQPMVGLNISLDGGLTKNLSLYNPFDVTLYVKEITAWIAVTSENTSHSADTVCSIDNFQSLEEYRSSVKVNGWLDISSNKSNLPLMALRPYRSWEISPHSMETIMEINFLAGAEGIVYGAFSLEMHSSLQEKTDVIVVPLEAEVHGKTAYTNLKGSVLVYLESIPCEECESSIILSLKNMGGYLLHITKINEVTESNDIFHIKYMDRLLLFPGSVTQIAVITCPVQEPPDASFDIHWSCKVLVFTNDSANPQIDIPCQDVVMACSKTSHHSYLNPEVRWEKSNSGSVVDGSMRNIHSPLVSSVHKTEKIAEADESVLRNWRSHGTNIGKSVLVHDEVLFPMVQVGSHCSKWITVKNPSHQPVLMQLILNSGTVIHRCRSPQESAEQPLSSSLVQNEFTRPTSYGFSIAGTATTEAFIHPYGEAILGPIIFHPSSRCGWTGSALIRNNLSGVEWLSLIGYGGTFSMVLLEGSEPIKNLEFKLNLPNDLNTSLKEMLFHMENITASCSLSLSKEFDAKNTGDLPLEVRKIEVSGSKCGLDGFMVHTCKAFSLEPGESRKLRISYRTDFSAAVVHRDLELGLVTGNFVIPMKATLPIHIVGVCRKSNWVLLKKLSLVVFIAVCMAFLVSGFLLPKATSLGSQDCVFKNENASVKSARKLCLEHDQRSTRFSMYNNMSSWIRPVRVNETSKLGFIGGYSDCTSGVQDQLTCQKVMSKQDACENLIRIQTGLKEDGQLLQHSPKVISVVPETSCVAQEPQASNLTVKVGKEKSKRRRKRRSAGAGLLEVSSSQSGNSTPSSPISPVISFAPKTTGSSSPDKDNAIEAGNPFVKVANQHHGKDQVLKAANIVRPLDSRVLLNNERCCQSHLSQVPGKAPNKPVLLASATFPSLNQHVPRVTAQPKFQRSNSAINLSERAPGSNLKEKAPGVGVKKKLDDQFTYDIWGDHFSGLHLFGTVSEMSSVMTSVMEGDSQSFFVRGPQILVQKTLENSVAPVSALSNLDAVPSYQQNG